MTAIWVGVGGFFGVLVRFGLVVYLSSRLDSRVSDLWTSAWTLCVVNGLGSFILGILYALYERAVTTQVVYMMLGMGFCGGLTTFSSFSLDILKMLEAGRMDYVLGYVAMSVVIAVMCVYLGYRLVVWSFA